MTHNPDKKILNEMTWGEAEPILRAWHEGEPFEFWGIASDAWLPKTRGLLDPTGFYRIPPRKLHVPDDVWRVLPEWVTGAYVASTSGHVHGGFMKSVSVQDGLGYWKQEARPQNVVKLEGFHGVTAGDLTGPESWIDRPPHTYPEGAGE